MFTKHSSVFLYIRYNIGMTHRKRVGVVRGGPSHEYDVSLKTGAAVLEALRHHHAERYHARDIFIDKIGNWHIDGMSTSPQDLTHRIDVAFNALHGNFGEDGKVQKIFEIHGIPFTGSDPFTSAVGMNKALTRNMLKAHGVKIPYGIEIQSDDIRNDIEAIVRKLFHSFLMPAIVKPVSSGSSIGVTKVDYYDGLSNALMMAALHSPSVLVEEFVPGVEATCGVVEGFRGANIYALPPVEIRHDSGFFDFNAKYGGQSKEIVPATFSQHTKRQIESLASHIHQVLGLRHYSRSDFIIHPRRGIYVLEVNTLPGLTNESLLPKSLHAVGSSLPEFVAHVIERV